MIEVRNASFDDAEAIADWQVAMARETEDKPLDRATVLAGVRAGLADEAKGFYLIGECDGHAAASMLVTREWSDWRNAWFWWIQSVYVDAAFRRRGLYRAMNDALVARARARRRHRAASLRRTRQRRRNGDVPRDGNARDRLQAL